MASPEQELSTLYRTTLGADPSEIVRLQAHASERRIFRLVGPKGTVIGVSNDSFEENRAFVEFSKHFRSFDLPVPKIIAADLARGVYLQQDLGDRTLLDELLDGRSTIGADPFPPRIEALYASVLKILPRFQVQAGATLDYSLCHPVSEYGRPALLNDMVYFRQAFLIPSKEPFDGAALERDFTTLTDFLDQIDRQFFMYRDCQARNIMLRDEAVFFIDFQGGRRGPLQYDVASLLNQARAEIPQAARDRLLQCYLDALDDYHQVDRAQFLIQYRGCVIVRLMQVLATYGTQGWNQGKEYFLTNIPLAMKELRQLLDQGLPFRVPELQRVFEALITRFQEEDSSE